jgi:hypothetical protein
MRDYFENAPKQKRPNAIYHGRPKLRAPKPPAHMTFIDRQFHIQLRRSLPLRQEAHGDRVRAREHILKHQLQNDLHNEIAHIQGLQSHMNLPDHLRTRLADLQGIVE